jgi:hypothetical protein
VEGTTLEDKKAPDLNRRRVRTLTIIIIDNEN